MAWRLAKSLVTLRDQVNEISPNRSKASDGTIGNAEHSSRASDHNPNPAGVVCAIDITHDPAHGINSQKLAEMLVVSRDPRIKYVISNGKIANSVSVTKGGKTYAPWAWSPYTGANPHDHHCHLSVKSDKADDARTWSLSLNPSEAVVARPAKPELPVLRKGAKGDDVVKLQALLKFKPEDQDGKFGAATEAAVQKFQRAHDLVADGRVGQYTWDALNAS